MKLRNGVYLCPCGEEVHQDVKRVGDKGKGIGVDMVKCPKCGNFVSQKTKIEIAMRMERGHKV